MIVGLVLTHVHIRTRVLILTGTRTHKQRRDPLTAAAGTATFSMRQLTSMTVMTMMATTLVAPTLLTTAGGDRSVSRAARGIVAEASTITVPDTDTNTKSNVQSGPQVRSPQYGVRSWQWIVVAAAITRQQRRPPLTRRGTGAGIGGACG